MHASICNNFSDGSLQNTVYLLGHGFLTDYNYQINYYDGANNAVGSDNVTSDNQGAISSQHIFARGIDTPGTWHIVVIESWNKPSSTYNEALSYEVSNNSFIVQESAMTVPVITSETATNIGPTSATLNSNLRSLGIASAVNISFEYGTSISYGSITPAQVESSQGFVSATVTGLYPGAMYHYKAIIDGGVNGNSTGADIAFCTINTSLAGKITFASDRSSNTDNIFVMNADGSNPNELTSDSLLNEDSEPIWSPDGKKIAYVRNGEIYNMNADGSGQIALASGDGPSWSPDSKKIAYGSYVGNWQIWIMNADGSNNTKITNFPYEVGIP